jgi:hypothetical protein
VTRVVIVRVELRKDILVVEGTDANATEISVRSEMGHLLNE